MKNGLKIIGILLVILIILGLVFFVIDYNRANKDDKENGYNATIKAVVVKAGNSHLFVMGIDERAELYSVGVKDTSNTEFKQGQEILIYFDGNVMETYPAQLGNIGKIEVIKEKSDVQIPDNIIRYCYNSYDKVNITVSELTSSGISLIIRDTNELPYNYSHSYVINKKVKNKDYTGVGQKLGEDTGNSISGFTRNGCRIYMARGR